MAVPRPSHQETVFQYPFPHPIGISSKATIQSVAKRFQALGASSLYVADFRQNSASTIQLIGIARFHPSE